MIRAKGPFELTVLKVEPKEETWAMLVKEGVEGIPPEIFQPQLVEVGANFELITYYLSVMNHDPLLLSWNFVREETKWGKVPDSHPEAKYLNFRVVLGVTILELGALIMGQHLDLTLAMRYVQRGKWILETPEAGKLWSRMSPFVYMYSDFADYRQRVLRIIHTFEGDAQGWDTLVKSALRRFYNRKETLAIPWIYERFTQWGYPMTSNLWDMFMRTFKERQRMQKIVDTRPYDVLGMSTDGRWMDHLPSEGDLFEEIDLGDSWDDADMWPDEPVTVCYPPKGPEVLPSYSDYMRIKRIEDMEEKMASVARPGSRFVKGPRWNSEEPPLYRGIGGGAVTTKTPGKALDLEYGKDVRTRSVIPEKGLTMSTPISEKFPIRPLTPARSL